MPDVTALHHIFELMVVFGNIIFDRVRFSNDVQIRHCQSWTWTSDKAIDGCCIFC